MKAVKTPSWTIKFWAIAYVLGNCLCSLPRPLAGIVQVQLTKSHIGPQNTNFAPKCLHATFDVSILTATSSNNALPLVDLLLMGC
jgi:hypothetical protein